MLRQHATRMIDSGKCGFDSAARPVLKQMQKRLHAKPGNPTCSHAAPYSESRFYV